MLTHLPYQDYICMLSLPCPLTPLHTISCTCESVLLLYLQTLLLLTVHVTAHLSAHYCAAMPIPFAYASPYFTMTLTLIISLSYVLCSTVYKIACKGHSLFRLGLLCNPRTINIPSELTLFVFNLLSPPLYCICPLVLALQFASLLPDLTPVQVSFAIKSLATLVIRVDSRTQPTQSLHITLRQDYHFYCQT